MDFLLTKIIAYHFFDVQNKEFLMRSYLELPLTLQLLTSLIIMLVTLSQGLG